MHIRSQTKKYQWIFVMILMCFLLFTGGRAVYATNPPAEGSTETDSSEEPDLTTISGYDDYMTEQAKEAIQDLSNKAAEEKLIDALHDKLSDESLNTVNDGNKIINEIAKEQSLNASVWKSLFSKACESHNVPKNKKEVDAAVDALNDATDKLHILWWDGDGTGTNISAMKVMIEKLLDPSSPAYTVMSMCTTLGATLCLVFSVMNIMEKATERSVSTEALWRSFLQMCLGIWIIYNCLYLASAIIYIGGNVILRGVIQAAQPASVNGAAIKMRIAMWETVTAAANDGGITGLKGSVASGGWGMITQFLSNSMSSAADAFYGIASGWPNPVKAIINFVGGNVINGIISLTVYAIAIETCIRFVFTPVAVGDMFSEKFRSSGVRWLKGLAACALQGTIVYVTVLIGTNLRDILESGAAIPGFSPVTSALVNFTMIGFFAKSKSIANEIVGTH
ncbi:hypothetical protein [Clostridium fessum]|uniref:hypothetical protein n=1 Tax=Clostridium fessum TaxID=2126740 RepID=UPI0022DEB00B|nr:hypothetical protein [Clostridium fessum]